MCVRWIYSSGDYTVAPVKMFGKEEAAINRFFDLVIEVPIAIKVFLFSFG